MNTSRRTILVGLAALPVTSLPRITAPVADPTFSLIEQHRAAWLAFNNALGPDGDGAEAEDKAEAAARDALISSEPTTLAGLRAWAAYVGAHCEGLGDYPTTEWALATLVEAIRLLIPAGDA